jgi:hypothetical protein
LLPWRKESKHRQLGNGREKEGARKVQEIGRRMGERMMEKKKERKKEIINKQVETESWKECPVIAATNRARILSKVIKIGVRQPDISATAISRRSGSFALALGRRLCHFGAKVSKLRQDFPSACQNISS